MTSQELVAFLERKLEQHGVAKVVPDEDTLRRAYQRAAFLRVIARETETIRRSFEKQRIDVPSDLRDRIFNAIRSENAMSWDEAIWKMVASSEA